ncbi:flagellar hook-associated protein 2 [Paenalkalicoccus suaedae]|uniref:Flagellar hook-associated protein 2 n=1 Tax=Paenalkalicoccus suaedae TaxID=2592382 RepID=A0A859FHK1_9BACI|nr:flagellar hook-associated protein 2 [Paenalkalicoccus suaedae]QKS72308.1 flagellar hook-associated protein 2 [Paenalkalicoccus suaedae]
MRLTGFASGLDINQMVKDLMRAERMPVGRLEQSKQTVQWKMDQYREVNTKLEAFRTSIFDGVMRASNMLANKATTSNSGFVSATAAANSQATTLRISSVDRLATAATNVSTAAISGSQKLNQTQSIASQNLPADSAFSTSNDDGIWKKGLRNRETITVSQSQSSLTIAQSMADPTATVVKVNGSSFKVVTDKEPNDLLATEVLLKDDGELVFGRNLNRGDRVEVTQFKEDPAGTVFFSDASITTYDNNGNPKTTDFVFTSDQSLNAMMSEINASGAGVSAFYDSFQDKVSFVRKDTGVRNTGGNEMQFSGDFFTAGLNMSDAAETAAQNARFTVNGLTTERQTNSFDLNGLSLTLHQTFTESQSAVTIGTERDTGKIFDTIKKFVDDYNELIDMANGRLRQEVFRDYPPLTEEQREQLSESEIEKWEEKAQSGLLRNDALLSNGVNRFRSQLYAPVNSSASTDFRQLTSIGITTTRNFQDGGKLEINEDKLRAAIEADAEGVFQLFAADGPTQADKGIARRVRESANTMIDQISQRAGGMRGRTVNQQFTLGRELNSIEQQMSNFERRLKQVEERYWKQFTAMEKAISRSNSQSEALFAQMFGGNMR